LDILDSGKNFKFCKSNFYEINIALKIIVLL